MEQFGFWNSDVPFDVLSRLPTKDLLTLKCVSRGWCSLTSDRSFIKFQSQKKEPISGFFFQERYQWCDDDIETISYIPVGKEGAELHQTVFDFLPEKVVVLSSCNGLVCCRTCFPFRDPTIYVCNPLKKEWIGLKWTEPDKESSIGLAFDPSQDLIDISTNFKLVRVRQFETDMEDLYFSFEIYFSDTGIWKKAKEICQCNNNLYKNRGIFIGGVVYWLTNGDEVLSFNIENEISWLISVPVPTIGFASVPEACIGESDSKLHYVMVSEAGIHVWFLEDAFESKWVLKHSKTLEVLEEEHSKFFCNLRHRVAQRLTIDMSPWVDPLAFRDGFLLMRVSTKIFLYNVETNKMDEICSFSKLGNNSLFCPMVLPYSLSLVPLHRA